MHKKYDTTVLGLVVLDILGRPSEGGGISGAFGPHVQIPRDVLMIAKFFILVVLVYSKNLMVQFQ